MKKLQFLILALTLFFCACEKKPEACFTYEQNLYNISFSTCSLNATSYDWDFGDGENSIGANPDHKYNDFGTYEVTLRVGNEKGTTSTITQNVTLSPPANNKFAGQYICYESYSTTTGVYNYNVTLAPNLNSATEIYFDNYCYMFSVTGVLNGAGTSFSIPAISTANLSDTSNYSAGPASFNSDASVIVFNVTETHTYNTGWNTVRRDSLVRIQ